MPEIASVVPATPIAVEWGNDIRDRTVQRYASVSARNAAHPTPTNGDLSFLADSGRVEVYWDGGWRGLAGDVGKIDTFAGAVPSGYLPCNGAAVSRSTYASLFAYLNAAALPYGNGDGSTTFNVPDLRQRMPMGVAASGTGDELGETGGSIDHVHTTPNHTHAFGTLATASAGAHTHTTPAHVHALGGTATDGGGGSTSSGGSHSHSFSDTSSGPSSTNLVGAGGAEGAAHIGHTHSVSGTTGSGGSHTHTIPNHAHALGNSSNDGGGTSGSSGAHTHTISGATASNNGGNSGTANPPFLALNFGIKF